MPVSMEGRGSGVMLPSSAAVKLHEYQIPDLDEAAARIRGELLVLAALLRSFEAQVVMDLRTRTARTGLAHLPEIVFLVQPENALLRNARHFLPELLGFVVFAEDRDVQPVLRHAEPLRTGHQLPGKRDGILLEVIAEREIAEHLEERVVAARVADIFKIVVLAAGAHALLRLVARV